MYYFFLPLFFTFCSSEDDQEALFEHILKCQFDFPTPYWDNVSDAAKVSVWIFLPSYWLFFLQNKQKKQYEWQALVIQKNWRIELKIFQTLITKMLEVSVDQRYTAAQVLDHPWVNVSLLYPISSETHLLCWAGAHGLLLFGCSRVKVWMECQRKSTSS